MGRTESEGGGQEGYEYDVFLSHGAKDREVVREIAERLRSDGVRVWFEEGEAGPVQVEEGLERSRVLVFCLSRKVTASERRRMEDAALRFRERRVIPLRFDDTELNGALAGYVSLDAYGEGRERAYFELLAACRRPVASSPSDASDGRPPGGWPTFTLTGYPIWINNLSLTTSGRQALAGSDDGTVRLWDLGTGRCLRVLEGHAGPVFSVALAGDGSRAVSGSDDGTVRLWDLGTGRCLRVLKGHTGFVYSVALAGDGSRAVSGSADGTVRLWDLGTGRCLRVLKRHTGLVNSVALAGDGRWAVSGSADRTVRLWDLGTGRCLHVFEGHESFVYSVALAGDGSRAISGSQDRTVRLWDLGTGRCLRVLEGHAGPVFSVALAGDGSRAVSGSLDGTVRLWDLGTGRCLRVLEGHAAEVYSVAIAGDGSRVLSVADGGELRQWDLAGGEEDGAESISETQRFYTNAKVLLVGDSGVGKTGLSNRLAKGVFDETDSTDGAWATHWTLSHANTKDGVDREIWLWDFAGQVDYRLVHQLFMDDTAAAVLVFNPQSENPFDGLGQWDRDLQKAARKPFAKLLAAGRCDRGGLVVSRASMDRFMAEREFTGGLHTTSAKVGDGCQELRNAIVAAIDWESIPQTTSPALYHRLKQEILKLRDSGLVLIRLPELKQRMEVALGDERFELAELETVVGLLSGPGMIQRLDFGGFILLRPEILSRYAAAVVRKVRAHPRELGCISEAELLSGELDYQDFARLPKEDEAVVLRALLETFVSRAWCLRQPHAGSPILTFPSYFRRERPDQNGHPNVLVTYRFCGPADEIYATLVVGLHHTDSFEITDLWRNAADFQTHTEKRLGLEMEKAGEGAARLDMYFAPDVDENSRLVFQQYVHDHLTAHATEVTRLRAYFCAKPKCRGEGQPFGDQAAVDAELAPGGSGKVFCPRCGKPIDLRDRMETKLNSPAMKEKSRELQAESRRVIDTESLELILVGHAMAIAAEAGQIYRGYTNSDHGIDAEIEFKDDEGKATGKRLYLQLKSGDSYLSTRKRDGAEIFRIKEPRWREYWQRQAYPVILVVRTSDGTIRWMDISAVLRRDGAVAQIVFEGEPMTAYSVRQARDRALGQAGA
ncbi:MAG: DUF4365 domain-containing protein [Fimbriimonas sp.]